MARWPQNARAILEEFAQRPSIVAESARRLLRREADLGALIPALSRLSPAGYRYVFIWIGRAFLAMTPDAQKRRVKDKASIRTTLTKIATHAEALGESLQDLMEFQAGRADGFPSIETLDSPELGKINVPELERLKALAAEAKDIQEHLVWSIPAGRKKDWTNFLRQLDLTSFVDLPLSDAALADLCAALFDDQRPTAHDVQTALQNLRFRRTVLSECGRTDTARHPRLVLQDSAKKKF